jgi:hypothetical protein
LGHLVARPEQKRALILLEIIGYNCTALKKLFVGLYYLMNNYLGSFFVTSSIIFGRITARCLGSSWLCSLTFGIGSKICIHFA